MKFDGCAFDPAGYDASPCVVASDSGRWLGYQTTRPRQIPPTDDEENLMIAILMIGLD